jgi:hypothetical protein
VKKVAFNEADVDKQTLRKYRPGAGDERQETGDKRQK